MTSELIHKNDEQTNFLITNLTGLCCKYLDFYTNKLLKIL